MQATGIVDCQKGTPAEASHPTTSRPALGRVGSHTGRPGDMRSASGAFNGKVFVAGGRSDTNAYRYMM